MQEADYGYETNSVIIFCKTPLLISVRTLLPEEAKIKGFERESYPSQYTYRLLIDLWLIILKFDWKGKNNSPKIETCKHGRILGEPCAQCYKNMDCLCDICEPK